MSKNRSRSIERIGHLFLSTQSLSGDEEVTQDPQVNPPEQFQLEFESEKDTRERKESRNRLAPLVFGKSRSPFTLLDFLLDD